MLSEDALNIFLFLLPCLVLELPVYAANVVAAMYRFKRLRQSSSEALSRAQSARRYPGITVALIAYREDWLLQRAMLSVWQQSYPGHIEILVIIEGGDNSHRTYMIGRLVKKKLLGDGPKPNRSIHLLRKESRTGRVASLNYSAAASKQPYLLAMDADSTAHPTMVAELMKELARDDVIAATGSIDVAEPDTWVCRFQDLEYRACLSGMKYGLAELGMLNNISGAFGGFERSWLLAAGGWDNGTAEDLDLTIRLKCLAHTRGKRLGFAVNSVMYTDTPKTLMELIDQRLRWDGDLLYVYFMKNFSLIRPKHMGWRSFLGIAINGYLHQVFLPFVIAAYLLYTLFIHAEPISAFQVLLVYAIYTLFFASIYTCALKVRTTAPNRKASAYFLVLLYPFFALFIRLVALTAYFNEWITKAHEKSSMAPWKVLKVAYEKNREE